MRSTERAVRPVGRAVCPANEPVVSRGELSAPRGGPSAQRRIRITNPSLSPPPKVGWKAFAAGNPVLEVRPPA